MKNFNLISVFCFLTMFFSSFKSSAFLPTQAPLYWSPYEYCFVVSNNGMNGYIPEKTWQANIDWMNDNLKIFGYNMVSIDGWGDDFSFNENGYRTKHSQKWTHNYAWWSNYLQERGMVLGIYNNPLWVNLQAVNQGKLIKETNIPLSNIVNRNEKAKWFTWVQVEKEGAEEYVKGYIQYYADMGVKYLRVDFLSWFEDGIDHNPSYSVPINRPKEYYQTALRWMKEACDANDMTLSLVMPHLYNHAKTELSYAGGSMIRINSDVTNGGWNHFNNTGRGVFHKIWPTYDNTFDGFIHWSDISGFGNDKLILDGDFTRINTFSNNEEKKTAVSLQLIGGGPIAVADQHNTIGGNLWVYQNMELLDLNRKGFVGKPLSRQLGNNNSQVWKGKMPNGDWIVGLFNRENGNNVRSLDFQKDLNIPQGYVRDLWDHKDVGVKNRISESVGAHACKIYRISPYTNKVASPTFITRGGSYGGVVNLELKTSTIGASIYYTTDGTEPSTKSKLYTKSVLLTSSMIVKAVAIKDGLLNSFVVEEGYNINPKQMNSEMYIGGTFNNWSLFKNPMTYIGNNDWKSASIVFTPGTYSFKIANSSNWKKDDWANSTGLEGTLKKTTGGSPNATFVISESGSYYFSFNESTLRYSIRKSNDSEKVKAISPTFSLQGGTYDKVITLSLSTSTPKASIYYSVDGSEPSILYEAPIVLASSVVVKAITKAEGMLNSDEVNAKYNINPKQINSEMYVAGTFSGWSLLKNRMTYIGANDWKSNDIAFTSGTYSFKIANSSNWKKDDWANSTGLEGTLKKTTGGSPNATFVIKESGNYYFLFNEVTLRYSIVKNNITLRTTTIDESDSDILIKKLGEKTFTVLNVKNATVSVFSSLGVKVYSLKDVEDNQNIELNNLSSGIYIVNVTDGGKQAVKKILIK